MHIIIVIIDYNSNSLIEKKKYVTFNHNSILRILISLSYCLLIVIITKQISNFNWGQTVSGTFSNTLEIVMCQGILPWTARLDKV